MSRIGYYRLKLATQTAGTTTKAFYVNGVAVCTHTIKTRPTCGAWKQLKWLDASGQYRFFSFLEEHQVKDNPKEIGNTSNFITSLLSSQTDAKSIGLSNDRSMILRAQNVTSEEREILSGLFTSPNIQLYLGDYQEDNQNQYIDVTLKGDNIVRREKQRSNTFEVTIQLPKHYTVNRL